MSDAGERSAMMYMLIKRQVHFDMFVQVLSDHTTTVHLLEGIVQALDQW